MRVEPKKIVAPYLPFSTFLSSLDSLSQGVPPKIDRGLWRSQSGLMQGLIMNAYRFFGLVDETEGDASSEELNTMAKHPEQRPEVLRGLIEVQYDNILEKNDLTKMTMKMLEDAFEEHFSVTGATKQKAITFFLKAAKFSDMPLSPYLQSQLRNVGPRKKRGSKQRTDQDNGGVSERVQQNDPVPGVSSHNVRLASGGQLSITISANPFTMPAEDRNFFFSLVDMLQKYGQEHPEVQQTENEEEMP